MTRLPLWISVEYSSSCRGGSAPGAPVSGPGYVPVEQTASGNELLPTRAITGQDSVSASGRDARRSGLGFERAAECDRRRVCQRHPKQKFVGNVAAAWAEVMNLGRFDLA
ncbi:hypothetical protein BH11PSE8_BH11PSE8_27630 [soil metagenome]